MISLLLFVALSLTLAVILVEITTLTWVTSTIVGMLTSAFTVASMEGIR